MRDDGKGWTVNLQVSGCLADGGPARDQLGSHLRLLVGQLVQSVAHRGGSFVTVGGDALADRAAL
jgi:hypothetical protein